MRPHTLRARSPGPSRHGEEAAKLGPVLQNGYRSASVVIKPDRNYAIGIERGSGK